MKIDNSKNPNLKKAYTSGDGTVFYALVDPMNISTLRGLSAEKALRFMEMKITEKELRAVIKKQVQAMNEGDLVTACAITKEIEYRLDFITEERSILDLVCIYYYLKDENPDVPSDEINKKKLSIILSDFEAKCFFLRTGLHLCKLLSETQEKDLLSYLRETAHLADRMRRYTDLEESLQSSQLKS